MYDRVDGRVIPGVTDPSVSLIDEQASFRQEEMVESKFNQRFMSALKAAMEVFKGIDQTASLEAIVETREFQEVYKKMSSDVERGFDDACSMRGVMPTSDHWAGRSRLAKQTRLLMAAPILLQAYFERMQNPDTLWPLPAATESRNAYNYGYNTQEAYHELFSPNYQRGIRELMKFGYAYVHGYGEKNVPHIDQNHSVVRESDVVTQMYLLAHHDLRGREAPVTPYDGAQDELRATLETSAWLVPLLAEWQTASRSGASESDADTFFKYFRQRYGVRPSVTREDVHSAMKEGHQIFQEDAETVSAHQRRAHEAEKMRDLFRDRHERDKDELGSVMHKIRAAETALKNWDWVANTELDKVDQRSVSRYAGFRELLNERPEIQRASEERFDLFNAFPDIKHGHQEDHRLKIGALTHERDRLIKEYAQSIRKKTKEALQSRVEQIEKQIDALTESAAFVFQSQQEDFMKTMIAAEHAEKDLPILRARQESLVRRLERYKEAVPAQQEVVDEELNAMNDWFRIYDGSKYNREPQPGKYIDELDR